MKRIIVLLTVIVLTSGVSSAQYKGYDDKGPSTFNKSTNNLIFGFINPKNLTMNHSFNVSMISTGYGNVSLTSYTNSLNYKVTDRFNVSADVSVQYSPFASSNLGASYSNALQKNLSGVFLSRASLNYKISDNSFINFEYRNINANDYYNSGGYNPFYSGFGNNNINWR